MLYGNKIYRLYLELVDKRKKSKSEFENVVFDLCDFVGGNADLSVFIESGGLHGLTENHDYLIWGVNMYQRINWNRVRIRIMDPKLLRDLIFRLDEFAKYSGYDDFEDCFYVEENGLFGEG